MSLSAAVIRELVAAGVTGDALVAACERIEAASKPARMSGAERTAKWRESKKTIGVSDACDVTVSHTPSPLVPPFPPAPPIPPIIPPTPAEISFGAGELETKLRKAAGWESHPAPNLAVTGPIETLIASGAILETDVLPVLKAHAPRVRRPSSWNYFVPIIQDAVQARLAAATGPPKAGEVVPFANPTRSPHGPRPNTIAAGFELLERAIEREERALAASQGGNGRREDDPLSLP